MSKTSPGLASRRPPVPAAEAAERVESTEGKVPVVCTPSGGRPSVRLELPKDWAEELSDEDLLAAIEAAQ